MAQPSMVSSLKKKADRPKKPGIVFVHGGPQRQMLLGWSYMDYYSNAYALNQYLAELGFVVLSVNYRLGIGYGYEFHRPAKGYYQGAVEYQDIKAGGEFLASLAEVNPEKIGIYGGSYGGYHTALALARDSDLFKVGVDIHGVHDLDGRYDLPEGYEVAPDYESAKEIAWKSSPIADLKTWTSPVLFIHSDDDRNVNVSQTTNLIRRFEEMNKPYESIFIPGDTHHWMKWSNMIRVHQATADFFEKAFDRLIWSTVHRPQLLTVVCGLSTIDENMINLKSLHHIAIICSDYERSKKFYTDVLGFKIIREVFRQDRKSFKLDLELNGLYLIELFSFPDPPIRTSGPEACGLRHLAFEVENIEESIAFLIKSGINTEPIRVDEHTGKRFTFFS